MSRKRKLAIAFIVPSVAGLALWFGLPSRKTVKPPVITEETAEKIRPLMTLAEVEAILGGPPGDYRTNQLEPMSKSMFAAGTLSVQRWCSDRYRVEIMVSDGRVLMIAKNEVPPPVPPPSFLDRVRWFLWPPRPPAPPMAIPAKKQKEEGAEKGTM